MYLKYLYLKYLYLKYYPSLWPKWFCLITGSPTPEVSWWRDSHLIDSTYETTFSSTVQNTLTLTKVTRSDLGATLTCQAKNNNISLPTRNKVSIDLKCKSAIDPRGQTTVTIFTNVVRPSHFLKSCEAKQIPRKNSDRSGGTVGLVEWIIDSFFSLSLLFVQQNPWSNSKSMTTG